MLPRQLVNQKRYRSNEKNKSPINKSSINTNATPKKNQNA